MTTNQTPTGRGWAYTGAILGGVVSIAANVAHSYVPPAKAPDTWQPNGGAVIGAIFWPVALFVVIEIFARIEWPDGRRWAALRWLGLLPVALVAAVVSYRHMSGLLAFYGDDGLTAVIGPLAVDGLMVMATGALIATSGQRQAATPDTKPDMAPDNVQASVVVDLTPDTPQLPAVPDTAPVSPDSPPPVGTDTAPAIRRTVKPAVKATDTAAQIARLRRRQPDITQKAVAARLEISERTAARYWGDTAPAVEPAKTNGHAVPTLTGGVQ